MYLRAVHSTWHLPTLYNFIRAHPLGLFTTAIPLPGQSSIQSSHIPWIIDTPSDYDQDDTGSEDTHNADHRASASLPLGTLRGHLSRPNPQAKALIAAAKAQHLAQNPSVDPDVLPQGGVTLADEVLIVFTGPVQHYVTPKFYTATKPATGKVVPTWNYEAVQAYGRLTIYPSTTSDEADAFLSKAIRDLSHAAEVGMGYDGKEGRAGEWEVDDAPERFIGLLKKAIVGVRIEVTSLGGKFKMSQESKADDREGVIAGFEAIGRGDMAAEVQRLAS